MATIQTNLTCELQKAVKVQYLDGNLFSQDAQANQINVAVFDNGEPATISGTVTADIIRADGGTVAATGGTIEDNVASITMPSAAYAIPGVCSIVIKLTSSGVTTSIAAVVANVYESSTDTVIDPGTIIPSVTTLISAIETAVASIPADYSTLWTTLAPAFSSSTAYTAGQYVTYNGGLYKFTTSHTGSWAAGDVTSVNIGNEISSLKSALNVIDDTVISRTLVKVDDLSRDDTNYWHIPNAVTLTAGKAYKVKFTPNTTFTCTKIQAGNGMASGRMTLTIAENISFVSGTAQTFDFVPAVGDEKYFRIAGEADKFSSLILYEVDVEFKYKDELDSTVRYAEQELSKAQKTQARENIDAAYETDLENVESVLNSKILASGLDKVDDLIYQNDTNYWKIPNTVTLVEDKAYKIEFTPNTTFTCSKIQAGNGQAASRMTLTIAENISFASGVSQKFDFVPDVGDEIWFRMAGDAGKFSSVVLYETVYDFKYMDEIKTADATVDDECVITKRINNAYHELRIIGDKIGNGIDSLIGIQSEEGTTQTVTIPSVGTHERYLLRVGLHYGQSAYTPSANEIFFGGNCRKDFSDVRFFDSNGKMLKARLGKPFNIEPLEDSELQATGNLILSNGRLISYSGSNGILRSNTNSNGHTATAIAGTSGVATDKPSNVYGYTGMYPVFVDSSDNIFAYAGGKLYKLSASDNYETKTAVVDFSYTKNGIAIYPDIQPSAFAKDTNGNMYFGTYATTSIFHVDIFASSDGGDTWSLVFHDYDGNMQHVHHIHADKYSTKVYAGIDDGGGTLHGSYIYVTDDGGSTWSEMTHSQFRGMDYYPTYFGNGYQMGGGETYYMGDATIYRSEDNVYFDRPVMGYGGVRTFVDFGDDSIIVAGVQQADGTSENDLLVSFDKGKTWETLYSKLQDASASSGKGFRLGMSNVLISGDTENCSLFTKDNGNVKSIRIYKGSNHYYREAYILLKNTDSSSIELTVKTGYLMAYPHSNLLDQKEHTGLDYRIPFNEGIGKYVADSNHNVKTISAGGYKWYPLIDSERYGDAVRVDKPAPVFLSSAVKIKGESLNMGVISKLDYSKNYSITFWFNFDRLLMDSDNYQAKGSKIYTFFRFGNLNFYIRNYSIGAFVGSRSQYDSNGQRVPSLNGMVYSDQFVFVGITMDNSNNMTVYINGCPFTDRAAQGTPTWPKLNAGELVLNTEAGYISDLKVYGKVISAAEMMDIYRGF